MVTVSGRLLVPVALDDHDSFTPRTTDTQSRDSMHLCLNVDEIVRLIGHKLVASRGNATAVALACCCKGLEDPMLDTLWEKQDQLLPLLQSFPRDVWQNDRCKVSVPVTFVFRFFNDSKVFQKIPDDDGMGSFPEVRSKDTKAQTIWHSQISVFGSSLGSPTFHQQRTLAPESENARFVGDQWIVYSIRPLVPLPQRHIHLP